MTSVPMVDLVKAEQTNVSLPILDDYDSVDLEASLPSKPGLHREADGQGIRRLALAVAYVGLLILSAALGFTVTMIGGFGYGVVFAIALFCGLLTQMVGNKQI